MDRAHAVEKRQIQGTLSFRENKLRAPLCAQCRSPMTIALCEPDFADSIVATYRCAECDLLDRAEIPIDIERPYTEPRLALNARTCALNAAVAHASM